MKKNYFFLILTLYLYACSSNDHDTIVKIENGSIKGTIENGVKAYKGIPYASPPVGELRWKPPQPAIPWTGIRDASQYCLACPQPVSDPHSFWARDSVAYNEDCLFLNVWTNAKPAEKQAVMVWIHGGAFTDGAGSFPEYNGASLAKKGVVVVTINYRLGPLGFLAHPELSKESEHHSSGNYGLLDQIFALQWVQRNIAKFGGDPGNVTIFGNSAGSRSVISLIASPLTKGLFHRAIAQSGTVGRRGIFLKEKSMIPLSAEEIGLDFAGKLGAKTLAELRNIPAHQIINVYKNWLAEQKPRLGPIVDGYVIPELEMETFIKGKQNDITIMIGTTALEMSPLTDPKNVPNTISAFNLLIDQNYGQKAGEFRKVYQVKSDEDVTRAWLQSLTDRNYWFPTRNFIREVQKEKSNVYLYYFAYVPPHKNSKYYGAHHASETAYVFNNLRYSHDHYKETDQVLANALSDLWTNFAKTGVPSANGVPEWLPYKENSQYYMEIGKSFSIHQYLRKDQMEFFNSLEK